MTEVDDSALYPRRDAVTLYVVYDHPRDHPNWWVVRPHDVADGVSTPREVCAFFRTLERAREWCAQFGCVQLPRDENDDPVITEVWL